MSLVAMLFGFAPLLLGEPDSGTGKPWQEAEDRIAELRRVQEAVEAQVKRTLEATVAIELPNGMGSGVIVSPNGLVLTAAHVFVRPGRIVNVVLSDGRRYRAETLGTDVENDAGMLRILRPGPFPSVARVPEHQVPLRADWCFALGHPGGYDLDRGAVLRVGRIAQIGRNSMQTDCELMGGDSGGPLFNLRGELIGIHTSISPDVDDNFHVSSSVFSRNWDALTSGAVIERNLLARGGFLGVRSRWDLGQRIIDVREGSPAEDAGLLVGDLILSINDAPLRSEVSFQEFMQNTQPSQSVEFRLERAGESTTVNLVLSTWPRGIRPAAPIAAEPG